MAQFFTKYFPNVVPIWSGDGGVTQAINDCFNRNRGWYLGNYHRHLASFD